MLEKYDDVSAHCTSIRYCDPRERHQRQHHVQSEQHIVSSPDPSPLQEGRCREVMLGVHKAEYNSRIKDMTNRLVEGEVGKGNGAGAKSISMAGGSNR